MENIIIIIHLELRLTKTFVSETMVPTCSDATSPPKVNSEVMCNVGPKLPIPEIQPIPSQDVPVQPSALQMDCEEILPPVLPSVSYDVPELIMPSIPVESVDVTPSPVPDTPIIPQTVKR